MVRRTWERQEFESYEERGKRERGKMFLWKYSLERTWKERTKYQWELLHCFQGMCGVSVLHFLSYNIPVKSMLISGAFVHMKSLGNSGSWCWVPRTSWHRANFEDSKSYTCEIQKLECEEDMVFWVHIYIFFMQKKWNHIISITYILFALRDRHFNIFHVNKHFSSSKWFHWHFRFHCRKFMYCLCN